MIGPGSKELLFLAGLALDSELIANTPCWVSYIPQAIFLAQSSPRYSWSPAPSPAPR